MVYDPETLELDFDDDSLTANMRCAYPLELDPERVMTGWAGIRRTS
jgi:phosphoenolpyruvate carboxykinase (ATP)